MMTSSTTTNLIQAELIRRYHSRQSGRLGFMSLEDAARQWIGDRAAKFRAYCQRRQIHGEWELTVQRLDRSIADPFAEV